jgi:hypothetical protein
MADSLEDVLRGLREQQHRAAEDGDAQQAALLHLLIVIEELVETVGELHERVTRLERR